LRQEAQAELSERTDSEGLDWALNFATVSIRQGQALVIFGAGLVLSNPTVRRYLGQVGLGNLASAALPDLELFPDPFYVTVYNRRV
jgi:hypothetical protein